MRPIGMGEALAPFVVVRRKATMMVALFAAMLVTFASAHAWAIEMHTSVDGAVEAGGDIEVTLQASSTSDMPPDPLLSVPAGLSVTGTSASRQSQLSLVNGVISAHRVLIVTFTVHTTAAGKFTVTPSVKVDGKRTNGPSARINVVAAGTLAQRQQPLEDGHPAQALERAIGSLRLRTETRLQCGAKGSGGTIAHRHAARLRSCTRSSTRAARWSASKSRSRFICTSIHKRVSLTSEIRTRPRATTSYASR